MRIEKKYYSEEAELWQRAEQEIKAKEAELSEEKREEQKLRMSLEADEFAGRLEAKAKENYQVIPQERLDRFQELARKALALAEEAPMDIIIDTEHFFGKIQMSADCFMIQPSSSAALRTAIALLIQEAESVTVASRQDGQIEMTFVFPFCSEVSRYGNIF